MNGLKTKGWENAILSCEKCHKIRGYILRGKSQAMMNTCRHTAK